MQKKALLLSAGYGSRLKPLTNIWPKCLMPIGKKPLLEYWIDSLIELGVERILVNVHYFSDEVISFLSRDKFNQNIDFIFEKNLLGTAGTLKENIDYFRGSETILVHADNFCTANFENFFKAHENRPKQCPITMMTFDTDKPESCGVIETNQDDILISFHEKVKNPPTCKANAAVYLLEPSFLEWLEDEENITDFSTDIIPRFIDKIFTWKNDNNHIDIGTIANLVEAQKYCSNKNLKNDLWFNEFLNNPIHNLIQEEMIKSQS